MIFPPLILGMDLREKQINIAVVKMKKRPELVHVQVYNGEDDWIEEGRIKDPVLFVKFVKKILKTHLRGLFNEKQVHVSIPTKHVILRKITFLPDLPEKELALLIENELGDSIHLPFERPTYDFVKVGTLADTPTEQEDGVEGSTNTLDLLAEEEEKQPSGPKSDILFLATDKDLTQDIEKGIMQSGFKPLAAEIRALSLHRLINHLHPSWLQETEIVLDIGLNSSDIHIFQDGTPTFTRNVEVDKLNYYDQEDSFDEDRFLEVITGEITRALNFYRYSLDHRNRHVKQLILMGEFPSSLAEKLGERLDFPIAEVDYSAIASDQVSDLSMLSSCAVAIGLALRGLSK